MHSYPLGIDVDDGFVVEPRLGLFLALGVVGDADGVVEAEGALELFHWADSGHVCLGDEAFVDVDAGSAREERER